jgi:hypothetical protein
LSTSRATYLLPFVARYGEHPELVWNYAREHMKELLAKEDALGVNSFAAGLFNFSSEPKDAETLEKYATTNLPEAAGQSVAKAVDEIGFRTDFKARLLPQLQNWMETQSR